MLADAYLQNDSLTVSSNYLTAITTLLRKYEKDPIGFNVALPVMLNKQANIRTYNGERVYTQYWKAYKLSKRREYLVKSILSFCGVLKFVFKIKKIRY